DGRSRSRPRVGPPRPGSRARPLPRRRRRERNSADIGKTLEPQSHRDTENAPRKQSVKTSNSVASPATTLYPVFISHESLGVFLCVSVSLWFNLVFESGSPMIPFRTTRRVEFCDTDMAGIAHFANFFRWMESAEVEFLRARGLSVKLDWEGQTLGFPRVSATCDFMKPARFQDLLDIAVTIERIGAKSVTYA